MFDSPSIRLLKARDSREISEAFVDVGSGKSATQFNAYFREQEDGLRQVLVAYLGSEFAGYVTIVWRSPYPYFAENQIPEIKDLNVPPRFRRRGIASALLDRAEQMIGESSPIAGIGVGLHPGYNAAQRLYVCRGYVPDGAGLTYDYRYVQESETVTVDDQLVLFLTKVLQ